MQTAQGRPATWRIEARDDDGLLLTTAATVTVTVTDPDGDTIATGAATPDGTTAGVYTFPLPATVTDTLGLYGLTATGTWAGATWTWTGTADVRSALLFDLHHLRDHDPALNDPDLYPAWRLRAARDAATDRLETAALVPFTHRRRIVTGRAVTTTDRVLLPDAHLVSVGLTVDDTPADPDGYQVDWRTGEVVNTGGSWTPGTEVTVDYTAGVAAQPPGPVSRAALLLAVEYLVPSTLPPRATSQATDLGEFRISVANPEAGRFTGIPEVDAVVNEYGLRRPPVGGVRWV